MYKYIHISQTFSNTSNNKEAILWFKLYSGAPVIQDYIIFKLQKCKCLPTMPLYTTHPDCETVRLRPI